MLRITENGALCGPQKNSNQSSRAAELQRSHPYRRVGMCWDNVSTPLHPRPAFSSMRAERSQASI